MQPPSGPGPRHAAASLGIVVVLLAGCLGSTAPPEATGPGLLTVEPADFDASTGAVEGHVLDESQLPVANATVTLHHRADVAQVIDSAVAAADGRFVFHRVPPGSYGVSAEADGFARVTRLTDVQAGRPTDVTLTLTEVPSDRAYLQVLIQAGLISCAFAVVVVSGVCLPGQTEPVFGPYQVELKFEIPVGHQATLSETDWATRSQVMRNWFFKIPSPADDYTAGEWMGDAIGPAVLRKEFWPGEVPSSFAQLNGDPVRVPPSDENYTIDAITYYDGSYQQEINGTGSAACAQNPIVGYCTGAGAAFQMRYDQYVTTFVNQAPESLATYTALPDE